MNALDFEFQALAASADEREETSPAMLLLDDPAPSYRLECNSRIYNGDLALFCLRHSPHNDLFQFILSLL